MLLSSYGNVEGGHVRVDPYRAQEGRATFKTSLSQKRTSCSNLVDNRWLLNQDLLTLNKNLDHQSSN